MTGARPIEGLVVVEAVCEPPGHALRLAAAMAGRILADLGAHVVQIDMTDPRTTAADPGLKPLERFLSARKQVVTGGVDEARKALRDADVAVVDRRARRAIGIEALPRLVALLSLFGGTQTETDIPASEFTVAALGGLLNMVGDPERQPLQLGGHQEAYALGLSAFCGLAAVLARETNAGPRVTIDANLLDTIVWLNWKAVPMAPQGAIPPGRAGAAAEWQVLRCADGWVALVYQDPDWAHLCELVDDDRLREPRFATRQGRLHHGAELTRIVEAALLTRTRRQIHERASALRLPLGPVWAPHEILTDPHNLARALFEELPAQAGDNALVFAPRLPVLWNGDQLSTAVDERPIKTTVGSP